MTPSAAVFWAIPLALLLLVTHTLSRYELCRIEESNEQLYVHPTLAGGMRRIALDFTRCGVEDLERGDVVQIQTGRLPRPTYSRVIALPGERVAVSGVQVLVDGKPLELAMTYAQRPLEERDFLPELRVPADCVFVLNDNRRKGRSDQSDSRALGPVPVAAISRRFGKQPPVSR